MLRTNVLHCDNEQSVVEGSQPAKGPNDDAGAKDPMKTKELEDKYNGKILENGVCLLSFCLISDCTKYNGLVMVSLWPIKAAVWYHWDVCLLSSSSWLAAAIDGSPDDVVHLVAVTYLPVYFLLYIHTYIYEIYNALHSRGWLESEAWAVAIYRWEV